MLVNVVIQLLSFVMVNLMPHSTLFVYSVSDVSKTLLTEWSLRLVEKEMSEYKGRVDIYINNHWGSVCGDSWGDIEAAVVCRQLGWAGPVKGLQ